MEFVEHKIFYKKHICQHQSVSLIFFSFFLFVVCGVGDGRSRGENIAWAERVDSNVFLEWECNRERGSRSSEMGAVLIGLLWIPAKESHDINMVDVPPSENWGCAWSRGQRHGRVHC